MSNPDKTYSGQKAYHEMLIRAQAMSPALTYVFCKLLLSIKVDPAQHRQRVRVLVSDPYYNLFSRTRDTCIMARFGKEIFNDFTVWAGAVDYQGTECYVAADTQFVEWLKTGVVVMDDEKQLVTITL